MHSDDPAEGYSIAIAEPSDAYLVSRISREVASSIGFSDYEAGMVGIAVAEIATNVVRYAMPGVANIKTIYGNKGIEIVIEDDGPGIENLDAAMIDGYSTHDEPSIGKGLGSAKRSVQEFIVDKTDQQGTTITLRHYLPAEAHMFDFSAVSYPAEGEYFNGDSYFFKSYRYDHALVAVIDGAGHGEKAHQSAAYASHIISEKYLSSLDKIMQSIDRGIRKAGYERPVEAALIRITPDLIEYCGVGNVDISAFSEAGISFPLQNGSLGLLPPKEFIFRQNRRPSQFTLVIHSDGVSISEKIRFDPNSTASGVARDIYQSFSHGSDDSTVLVLRA